MGRRRLLQLVAGSTSTFDTPTSVLLLLLLLSFATSCCCRAKEANDIPSSCGNIHNISCPFVLKAGDDHHRSKKSCGHFSFELACQNNRTILYLQPLGYFYVEEIDYNAFTVRLVDPGVAVLDDDHKDICSSIPLFSFSYYYLIDKNTPITFIDCPAPVLSTRYIDTTCGNRNTSNSFNYSYSYVVYGSLRVSEVEDSCRISKVAWVVSSIIDNGSLSDIHDRMVYGFVVPLAPFYCRGCRARSAGPCSFQGHVPHCRDSCGINDRNFYIRPSLRCLFQILESLPKTFIWFRSTIGIFIGLLLAARFLCGIPCLLALLIYKLRRRHLSMYDTIEDFLQGQNNLIPIRYNYSDIKKITKGFKNKLGEGGFGTVYKGKLRSGLTVAVKMMGKSKATGQEFINEVATIGTIHHVNVVQLIGFCFEGPKRALIYEFMPNGSLEKYIFPREEEGTVSLSCEKMYEISFKVAGGIEYLHRGCAMQILHFDIKPHNILLDENFNPKISDFGLAKLYGTDDSFVTLTAARGTMGYMAPELFYKNIGGISYKADVYSFGMLLMEMAGRRKNLNPFVDHSSQIYFPSWVYDQFNEGKDIEIGDATEEERKMVKKMIIVALWCIQLKPSDRPSMNKVVEMLERDVELLQMPPKPFLCPQETSAEDHGINPTPAELTTPFDVSITQSSD